MPWVKLIGGPHDGQVEKVDDDQVEVVKQQARPLGFGHRNFGLMPAEATIGYARYTRRELVRREETIIFFAHVALSDIDALKHALAP
jgi:hypothetical protein